MKVIPIRGEGEGAPYELCGSCDHQGTETCDFCEEADQYEGEGLSNRFDEMFENQELMAA